MNRVIDTARWMRASGPRRLTGATEKRRPEAGVHLEAAKLPISFLVPRALVGLGFTLLLTGCPNMEKQSNYRAYEPSVHFADGTSARPTPAHTVARDQALAPAPFLTGRNNGQLVTQFPIPITSALIERGRERYTIYCAVCHGEDGYGHGIIVRRGFPVPPSYHEERLRQEPIGHFFEVITQGFGAMYAYADRVNPTDRWAIIAYIRALQRSQHSTLADVPADHRAALGATAP